MIRKERPLSKKALDVAATALTLGAIGIGSYEFQNNIDLGFNISLAGTLFGASYLMGRKNSDWYMPLVYSAGALGVGIGQAMRAETLFTPLAVESFIDVAAIPLVYQLGKYARRQLPRNLF